MEMVRAIRRNHGLEHGTVALLLEAGVRPPLGGNAFPGGFCIYGRVSTEAVTRAAQLVLERMRGGERELAISPYCGSNIVVGALVAGLLSRALARRRGGIGRGLAVAALAATAGGLLSRPLGMVVQRHLTTLCDVDAVEIAGAYCLKGGDFTVHLVRTRVRRQGRP